MDSLQDLLGKKAAQLDIAARKTEFDLIQQEIERLFGDQARLHKLRPNGIVEIHAANSSAATVIKYQQKQLLIALQSASQQPIQRIIIAINS